MRKWYLILAIVLVSVTGGLSKPVLDVDETTYYFGTVPQFSKIYHHYWFRSVGTDTVKIDSFNTGCSCAILDADNLRIPPGDSVLVAMTWDIGRRMNLLGQSTKIYYNRIPVPKDIGLRALVRMKPEDNLPFAIIPYRFEFGSMPTNDLEVDSIGFKITNDYDHGIGIYVVSKPLDGLEIVLPEEIEAKSTGYGYAKLGPQFDGREFEYSVTFELTDDDRSRFTVPIRRKIYK